MVAAGGKQRVRAWAPTFALALCAAVGLAGCEVADDVGLPAADVGPSVRSAAPGPPLPTQDAELAAEAAKNMTEVQRLLGAPPADVLMAGAGGIGSRHSISGGAKGTYSVTVACAGTPNALLTISQAGRRDGTRLQLNLKCGRAVEAAVNLESGTTTVQIVPNSSAPDPGAAAGFRLERRPPP